MCVKKKKKKYICGCLIVDEDKMWVCMRVSVILVDYFGGKIIVVIVVLCSDFICFVFFV